MTALVTSNLPLLAGAPDGIKRLRELVFKLAIQGRLLTQKPGDEPAEILLSRLLDDRQQKIRSKLVRAVKAMPPSSTEELGFSLPMGWVSVRLGEIGDWGAGATPARSNNGYYGGSMPWFKSGELTADVIDTSEESVTDLALKECSLRLNQPGDVLIAMYGATIGKTAILAVPATTNQAVCACTPFEGFFNRYLLLVLKALKGQFVGQGAGGAQPNISKEKIVATVIGLPPLAEQHRIVAKVDELMALCDRLEAEQGDAQAAHAQLVQALLASLTQAQDADDFRASWQRLQAHFHTLFTTEASIDALKQTVLQLAVMGKLVPQDRADEPPEVLLGRITKEAICLTQSASSKKSRVTQSVDLDEQYIDLPQSWVWTRLGSLVFSSGAGWSPSCEPRPRVGEEWGVLKVSAVSWGEFRPGENKALPLTLEARPEHEVQDGDFLVSRANTAELVARSVVVEATPPRLMLSDKIVRLRLTRHCSSHYVNLVNSSPFARDYYSAIAGGTSSSMKNVTREQILNLPLPLPPLAEQHRIVAKVDELMVLCDQLKTQLAESRQLHAQLADALVSQVMA